MPKHTTKAKRSYTAEDLKRALSMFQDPSNKLSVRNIAKKFGVPRSTFQDRVSGKLEVIPVCSLSSDVVRMVTYRAEFCGVILYNE